jgi:iron complex outermembrane receptor protein
VRVWLFLLGSSLCAISFAQTQDAITVTGTRVERPTMEIPASVDRVDADDIHFTRPMVNLSESLNRVPGISVQNRQNYAQDLQISSRGFGGRSTFGVRGLRLVTDGIPASFPDGQGQVSHWDLSSAGRIEVLRGPFAVMYGNASGGVINLTTERGAPAATADYSLGSFRSRRAGLQLGGKLGDGGGDGIVSGSTFHTDGYRLHSAADRDLLNAKLFLPVGGAGNLTVVANSINNPNAQDPLGLTRAQMNANPQQVADVANQFDTRKTVTQNQIGTGYAHRFSDWTLNATVYAGHRDVRQTLGIPLATQNLATHSGGVVDLDRDYEGAGLRLTRDAMLLGAPITFMVGGDVETMKERRKGFINNNGWIAALKRNEDDTVTSTGLYAQGEWRLTERWIALAGVRASRVAFNSEDFFIAPGNGNDSGAKTYSATTPAAGILYRLTPAASLYANAGRGFETPTFAELAYSPTGPGLNFALNASHSTNYEAGLKAIVADRVRVNFALFDIVTHDEIAVATNAGGRATYRNVGRTRRDGVELGATASLPLGFEAALAWTRMEAKFLESFTSVANTPAVPVTVRAGNFLPGVPQSAFYAELRWRYAPAGFTAVLEYQTKSRLWADDANTAYADGYRLTNAAANFVQQSGNWTLTEYVRVDNLTNRRYAGSVIVNDANLRFFEPSPGITGVVGLQAKLGF